MKWIICLFRGHREVTPEREEEIKHAMIMYGTDCWGSNAFSNIEEMGKLGKELNSCTFCHRTLTEQPVKD